MANVKSEREEGGFFIAVQIRTGNKKYFVWIVKSTVFFMV